MRIGFRPLGALPIALLALAWTPVFSQSSTPATALGRPMQVMPLAVAPAPTPAAPTASSVSQTEADPAHASLSETARAALDEALLRPIAELGDREVDALWFTSLRQGGRSTALQDALETASAQDAPHQATAMWLHAGILAREGSSKDAVDILKDLIDVTGDDGPGAAEARFERARLEDMRGRQKIARKAYTDLVRDLEGDAAHATLAQRLRLRLALLDEKKGDEAGAALSDLAREGDETTMRRASVVLGLRGEPEAALALFPRDAGSDAPDTKRFRHEARLAEWALQAKDAVRAQSLAWDASLSAKLRRDRNYAHTLLVESYRLDDSLSLLVDRLRDLDQVEAAAGRMLDGETLDLWIELLRETDRVDEAIALFEERGVDMPQDKRSALIEMYREDGRLDDMVAALRREITAEPTNLAWREVLSRFFLERGDRDAATSVWADFVESSSRRFGDEALLVGFHMLTDQGLDDLATDVAERAIVEDGGNDALAACLLLFGMHQNRGDLQAAEADLERMESLAAPDAPERLDLGEAWERLGRLDKAVDVLERVVQERGAAESGEDLAMHLAWLYSETGNEERALEEWRALWLRVNAIARRRYVEDRMMTVAARLGKLADIAFDLEQKLYRGEANEREAGLLVRLYTKVHDAVSANEVLSEFLSRQSVGISGESTEDALKRRVSGLEEKGRVYLACLDYYHFEETVRDLIDADPEGKPDYLRQLAMSQLERGRPDQARASLTALRAVEDQEAGSSGAGDAAEFEAGVLALAGLRDEAIDAYRIGIASNPDRIESWLLLGNLMKEAGQGQRAVQMFQQLAETADADDLFMIAVDGLLNLEAPAAVLKWARRATWERLAGRSDKAYLYQLSSDLSEAAQDPASVLVALESSLSIAGERRGSILRELIDRTAGTRTPFGQADDGDEDKKLAFSRRLLGLGEVVPPDVYLNLGASFLEADDPEGAARTFRKATDVPDRGSFERETAKLFEDKGYAEEALAVYQRVLSGDPTSTGLLIKVGEMQERLGQDSIAHELYTRGVELLLSRMPLTSTKEDKRTKQSGALSYWGARNVDDFDRYFPRARLGFEATLDQSKIQSVVKAALDHARADLETALAAPDDAPTELAHAPRALHRSRFARELALAGGRPDLARAFDLWLLDTALPADTELLARLVSARLERGQVAAARELLDATARPLAETAPLRYRVGQGAEDNLPQRLALDETRSLILPLIIEGREDDIRLLLARTDLVGLEPAEVGRISSLLNAAMFIGDGDLSLRLGREWIRLLFEAGTSEWQIRPVLDRLETVLGDDEFRGLCLYLAQKALDDPEKGQAIMGYLPSLAKKLDTQLFTTDQLFELLDAKEDLGYGYGMQSVLLLFGPEDRSSALRSMLPRLRPTARARFLIDLLTAQTEEISADLGEVITDSFPAYLEEADDMLTYSITSLASLNFNREVGLGLVRSLLKKDPDAPVAAAAEIKLLFELGHEEESIDRARIAWPKIKAGDDSDWMLTNARQQLQSFLAEHDLDILLDDLEVSLADDPAESATQRARLLFSHQRREEAVALIEDTLPQVEGDPEAGGKLLKILAGYRASLDGPIARLETLEEALALANEEQQGGLRRSLISGWRRLHQAQRALTFAEGLEAEEPVEESPLGEFAALGLPAGAVVFVNGQMITVGEDEGGDDRATIARVKEAADEARGADAELILRRLWRQFQTGISPTDRYGGFMSTGQGTPVWTWPNDKKPEAEVAQDAPLEAELYRGGLLSYTEPTTKVAEPPVSAYERLAAFDWGEREMQRILFTRTADALDADGTRQLIAGLLAARSSEAPTELRDELIGRIESGLAGKAEHIMLLDFLDTHPELVDARCEAVLDDLARTLQAGDFGPLRALARLYARRGDHTEAARLYRWLATKVAAIGAWYGDEESRVDADGLFKEAQEVLGAEGVDPTLLIDVAGDIVFFATAGSDTWARSQQDRFALNVWTQVLPPAEALARLAELTDSISTTHFESGPARDLAKAALPLYLKAGQIDRALVCLEVSLCTFDPSLFADVEYPWPAPTYPGNLSSLDYAAWFPEATADFPEPERWYAAAAAALVEWHQAGRIKGTTAARGIALASLRLGSESAQSDALTSTIGLALAQPRDAQPHVWNYGSRFGPQSGTTTPEGPEALTANNMLDLLDAARMTGQARLADSLELHLDVSGQLPIGRVPGLIERVLIGGSPARALAIGERYLATYHATELVGTMREAAQQLGATKRAGELKQLQQDEQAAREELAKREL